jgi:hypothetical protein
MTPTLRLSRGFGAAFKAERAGLFFTVKFFLMNGAPYIVMDFVPGLTLEEFAEVENSSARDSARIIFLPGELATPDSIACLHLTQWVLKAVLRCCAFPGYLNMYDECLRERRLAKPGVLGLFSLLTTLVGCGPTQEAESRLGRSGLAINLRFSAQSDVAAVRFALERKSCSGEGITPFSLSLDKPLEEIRLPGGIPGFEDQPLDKDSAHVFADMFIDLTPGCYDVSTQPLRGDATASQQCASASARGVHINDRQTTEVFLINQCQGDGRGAIDVIAALNHPPALTSLAFERSKFVLRCEEQAICATAKDPDGDPLEFVWSQAGGPSLFSGPKVVSTTSNPDGSTTQCVRATAEQTGQHLLTVRIYDLLHNPQGGGLIRFEEYFSQSGKPQSSRAELTFPFYAASNGEQGSCVYKNCGQLHQRRPELSSGTYTVDLDGEGPAAPLPVYCDMSTDGGGWTLVMNQVPSELLPFNYGTVNPQNFGSLTRTYRLGGSLIKALRPRVAWVLTDGSNRVYYRPDCVVDWENNLFDAPIASCNQGFTASDFTSRISDVVGYNGSRGIGQNNYGKFCSIRAFMLEGHPPWPAGAALSCMGTSNETVRLWFK